MALSNLSELRSAVQGWAARSDAGFVAQIPDFILLAEQRIAFGSEVPVKTAPIRVRAQETSADLTFTDGEASIPADLVEPRRLYWEGNVNAPINYLAPREFHTSPWLQVQYQDPVYPINFTVEGQKVLVGPARAGTGKLLYFARLPALVGDTDTNWVLTNAPGVYLQATLAEAYGYMRNAEAQASALQAYAGQAKALNASETRARTSGTKLYPNTVPTRTDRQ